ncbi:MAG TPA: hypothetical protein VGD36_19885, partial [Xanthobacteraceae bacterium]
MAEPWMAKPRISRRLWGSDAVFSGSNILFFRPRDAQIASPASDRFSHSIDGSCAKIAAVDFMLLLCGGGAALTCEGSEIMG